MKLKKRETETREKCEKKEFNLGERGGRTPKKTNS